MARSNGQPPKSKSVTIVATEPDDIQMMEAVEIDAKKARRSLQDQILLVLEEKYPRLESQSA